MSRVDLSPLTLSCTGYARIVFAFISFYHMPYNPTAAGVFYLLSQLLDALDGYAARSLNQSKL